MSFYREELENWLGQLDVKADKVVDIGGLQGTVRERTRTWEVKDYLVVDKENVELDNYDQVDLEDTPPTHMDRKLQGDIVFCLEVLEYLILPDRAFAWINAFMKPGGKAYISAPLVYPVHNEVEFDSLRYTENGLRRLAENAGLVVTNVHYRKTKKTYTDTSSLLTQYYATDGMKAARGWNHEITGYIIEVTK